MFLESFRSDGTNSGDLAQTMVESISTTAGPVYRFTNEFWTSGQRKASSLHEVSYRACFKPQLPRFFIDRLTHPGDIVYDPFCGRGTTLIEAALMGRRVVGNDINPLSRILVLPRLAVPEESEIHERIQQIPVDHESQAEIDLSMFFHPITESEIVSIKNYLAARKASGEEDHIDLWIRMVATNRLTGHSAGFFSVYTLPPNQATSPKRQQIINRKRNQVPEYRNTRELIMKKTKSLLSRVDEAAVSNLRSAALSAQIFSSDSSDTKLIENESIALVVTSPPFLNTVDYSADNWLRCWFNSIDTSKVERRLTVSSSLSEWSDKMQLTFHELHRVVRPGGYVAFEVGEVRRKSILLDEVILPLGRKAGFTCEAIIVNKQQFTKTSNIWGIRNNESGTNTNRIVLFRRENR